MIAIVYIGIITPSVPPGLESGGCTPGPPIVGRIPGIGPPCNILGIIIGFMNENSLTLPFHSLSTVLTGRGGAVRPFPSGIPGCNAPRSFIAGLRKPRLGFEGSANVARKKTIRPKYLYPNNITIVICFGRCLCLPKQQGAKYPWPENPKAPNHNGHHQHHSARGQARRLGWFSLGINTIRDKSA